MIPLPQLLIPSSLLYQRDLTSRVILQLKNCSQVGAKSRWQEVKGLTSEAEELLKRGDHINGAILLLNLGDICLRMGRLGPARSYYERARQLFRQRDFEPEQRYNEAVAIYALGLVEQFSGSEEEALDHYEQAQYLLERARNHWLRAENEELRQRCEDISALLERLKNYILSVRYSGGTTALPYLLLHPELITGESPSEAEEEEGEFGPFVCDAQGKVWFIRRVCVRIIGDDS